MFLTTALHITHSFYSLVAKRDVKDYIKRRPSIFWWTLINLLAAAFAVVSWTTCYYVFNFPEKPTNYELLRKVKRLPPIEEFPIGDTPDGRDMGPPAIFADYLKPDAIALAGLNRQYKRNYISNFQWDEYLTYVEGTYRVTHVRPLVLGDFFRSGAVIRAQAYVQPEDERNPPGPYPVIIELLLPTANPVEFPFQVGDDIKLDAVHHRAAVLYAAKIGLDAEPTICLTVAPLTYASFSTGDRAVPLAPPDPVNPAAVFPVMEENRQDDQ